MHAISVLFVFLACSDAPEFDIVQIVEANQDPVAEHIFLDSVDMTAEYILKHGLTTPILFAERTALDMKLPPPDFTIDQVRYVPALWKRRRRGERRLSITGVVHCDHHHHHCHQHPHEAFSFHPSSF